MTEPIHTSLPLSLEDMKRVITTPDVPVVINYSASKIKDRVALIYMANANLPKALLSVEGVDKEDVFNLIDAYVTLKSTMPNRNLLDSISQILYVCKGVALNDNDQQSLDRFSLLTREEVGAYLANEQRANNILKLVHVLDNIITFATYSNVNMKDKLKENSPVPLINDIDYTGYTFVNLFEIESFMCTYYSAPRITTEAYFTQQYDEYMYGGKNMFAIISNTFMIPLLVELDAGRITIEQLIEAQQDIEEQLVNTPLT